MSIRAARPRPGPVISGSCLARPYFLAGRAGSTHGLCRRPRHGPAGQFRAGPACGAWTACRARAPRGPRRGRRRAGLAQSPAGGGRRTGEARVAGGGAGRRLAGRGRRRESPAAGRGRRAGGEERKCGGARSRVAVRGKGAASRRRRRMAGRRRRGGDRAGGDDEAAAGGAETTRRWSGGGAEERRPTGRTGDEEVAPWQGGIAVLAGVSPSRGDAVAVSGLGDRKSVV